jgi:hypothetical protein
MRVDLWRRNQPVHTKKTILRKSMMTFGAGILERKMDAKDGVMQNSI